MATLNELLSESVVTDIPNSYIHDDIQFIIDKDLRTIAVPDRGIVAGVRGDKDVNRINFQMERYYNGFDMSTFTIRVNYIDGNGIPKYYDVSDLTIEGDMLYFTWLVGSEATVAVGDIPFVVHMFKTENDVMTQSFYTSINNTRYLKILDTIL